MAVVEYPKVMYKEGFEPVVVNSKQEELKDWFECPKKAFESKKKAGNR